VTDKEITTLAINELGYMIGYEENPNGSGQTRIWLDNEPIPCTIIRKATKDEVIKFVNFLARLGLPFNMNEDYNVIQLD